MIIRNHSQAGLDAWLRERWMAQSPFCTDPCYFLLQDPSVTDWSGKFGTSGVRHFDRWIGSGDAEYVDGVPRIIIYARIRREDHPVLHDVAEKLNAIVRLHPDIDETNYSDVHCTMCDQRWREAVSDAKSFNLSMETIEKTVCSSITWGTLSADNARLALLEAGIEEANTMDQVHSALEYLDKWGCQNIHNCTDNAHALIKLLKTGVVVPGKGRDFKIGEKARQLLENGPAVRMTASVDQKPMDIGLFA